jgi:hypothetical protein
MDLNFIFSFGVNGLQLEPNDIRDWIPSLGFSDKENWWEDIAVKT